MSEMDQPHDTKMDTLFQCEIEDEEDASCQSACAMDSIIYSCWILVTILVVWLHLPELLLLPGVGVVMFVASITAFRLSDRERFKPDDLYYLKIYGRVRKGIGRLALFGGCVSFVYCVGYYFVYTDYMKTKSTDRGKIIKELVYLGMTLGFMCSFQGLMMLGFSKSYEEGLMAFVLRQQMQTTNDTQTKTA